MMGEKFYRTIGVVPPENIEVFRDDDGNLVRDGGAIWDDKKRKWRKILWRLAESKYKVAYDDGKEVVVDKEPEHGFVNLDRESLSIPVNPVEEVESQEVKITKVEKLPPVWELQNSYISTSEKPEWDVYFTKELDGIEPVVALLPNKKTSNWLGRRLKHAPKFPSISAVR